MYDQHFIDPGSAGVMAGGFGPEVGFGPPRQPPETTSTSVAMLRSWVLSARSGQLEGYASELGRVREYVTLLSEKGFVTPHLMSSPTGPALYVVQRTRTPILPGQL